MREAEEQVRAAVPRQGKERQGWGDGGVKWGCYGGVAAAARQAHVGLGYGQSPFRGAEEASGMQSFGPQAETAPRHTPAFVGRPSVSLSSLVACVLEKFWLESSLKLSGTGCFGRHHTRFEF